MTETILSKIKAAFEEICPYQIRILHERFPKTNGEPFIIVNIESINTEKMQAEDTRIRYPVSAVVSVKAVAPFRYGISELRRVAAAYILPVMNNISLGITGFSESSETDNISEGTHTLEIKFRIKGVYTAYFKEEI